MSKAALFNKESQDHPRVFVHAKRRSMTDFMRYFWSMYVNDFDITKHCQPGLLGERGRKIHAERLEFNKAIVMDESPAWKHLYLCGVSNEGYDKNFHLVGVHSPGDAAVVHSPLGFVVEVENLKMLEIPALPDGYGGYPRSFTTCRNWQFGVKYYTAVDLGILPVTKEDNTFANSGGGSGTRKFTSLEAKAREHLAVAGDHANHWRVHPLGRKNFHFNIEFKPAVGFYQCDCTYGRTREGMECKCSHVLAVMRLQGLADF